MALVEGLLFLVGVEDLLLVGFLLCHIQSYLNHRFLLLDMFHIYLDLQFVEFEFGHNRLRLFRKSYSLRFLEEFGFRRRLVVYLEFDRNIHLL